jgi:hypothetical protein
LSLQIKVITIKEQNTTVLGNYFYFYKKLQFTYDSFKHIINFYISIT